MLRVLRAGAGVLLLVSGALMYAASWQRWAGFCGWDDTEGDRCLARQDDRFDFVGPTVPWEPVGDAAQLAGWSLLVYAVALVLLPWALSGRRLGLLSVVASAGVALAVGVVGVANLLSGLAGSVVQPVGHAVAWYVVGLGLPVLLVRLALAARGWALAATVWLVLATPLVAAFSYAVGPYDAQPWWEGISGLLTVGAGLCVLVAAGRPEKSSRRDVEEPGRRSTSVREASPSNQ